MAAFRGLCAAALLVCAGSSIAQQGAVVETRIGTRPAEAVLVEQRANGETVYRFATEAPKDRDAATKRGDARLVVLPRVIVELAGGADGRAVAGRHLMGFVEEVTKGKRRFAVLSTATGAQASTSCEVLERDPRVLNASTVVTGLRETFGGAGVPSDTRLGDQWHHNNTGQSGGTPGEDANMFAAWNAGFTGSGYTILVVDDSIQTNHPDIAPNYNAAGSYDSGQDDFDPNPVNTNDRHGTACAGKAAGANDGTNCVGAAYNAEIAGWRVDFGSATTSDFADALDYQMVINEITTNSYGPRDSFLLTAPLEPIEVAALENSVQNGRGGLGTVHVKAGGNGLGFDDDANFDGGANSRYFISVSATDHNGVQSDYSEPGACHLVNAPSSSGSVGTTTSDIEGLPGIGSGYTTGSFTTDSFGGTSSACPLVAGVVALVLEANPALTWRDVQYVLALSAQQNDPSDPGWAMNGAGHMVNHKYGYGRIDAAAAVQLAQTWVNVGPDFAEDYVWNIPVSIPIPDDGIGDVVISLDVMGSEITEIEFVEFTIDLSHEWQGDVDITLTAPSGTESIVGGRSNDSAGGYIYMFTSRRHIGEDPNGTWTLRFFDTYAGLDTGTVNDASLRLIGLRGDIEDCNDNGMEDSEEIASNPSLDCDFDNVLDSCQIDDDPSLDCDNNGVLDSCEIQFNFMLDCNNNGVLDSCEIDDDPSLDCDNSGVLDACEILDDPGLDCNNDFLLDSCEIDADPGLDCDGNGVLDMCQILDDPMLDCDGNGMIDSCEIFDDPSLDCDSNGEIDLCEIGIDPALDCNQNSVLDSCEIGADASLDCDADGVLDSCQIENDPGLDCDVNGALDACELLADPSLDCDDNGVIDACEIAETPALDADENGVLDVCEPNACLSDFDNDGDVDLTDFGTFGAAFGSMAGDANYNPDADYDSDGDVDLTDFGTFGSEFGATDC